MASALAKAIAVPTMGSCFSSHLGASWRVECSPSVPVRFSTVPKNVMASPAIPPDLVGLQSGARNVVGGDLETGCGDDERPDLRGLLELLAVAEPHEAAGSDLGGAVIATARKRGRRPARLGRRGR
jgi:hypothetical protein